MPRNRGSAGKRPEWANPAFRDPRHSHLLARRLAVLGCFSATRRALGITELAAHLGITRSTTDRYVHMLVALGYLEKGPYRKYRLSLRVTDFGIHVPKP